jgi:hypothetical protein
VADPASFVLDLPRRDTRSKQVNGKELSMKRPIFPFSAILGQELTKKRRLVGEMIRARKDP